MSLFCCDSSFSGRDWRLREHCHTPAKKLTLRNGRVIPELILDIIARRGVDNAASYLEPGLKAFMPNPSILQGMDEASARFAKAIENRERIAIYGDYDVDGATSTAQILRYLKQVGIEDAVYYIPQRLSEGYGANTPAVEKLCLDGNKLLVFVDNGTGAFEPLARAAQLGAESIVIDHHEVAEDGSLPQCILVNPKRPGEDGTLAHLCTAGLVFMFLVAVNRYLRENGWFTRSGVAEPRIFDLLGLVALGTVADVMKLRTLNRAYVTLGLPIMREIPGIDALMTIIDEERREREIKKKGHDRWFKSLDATAYACGFMIGPCINAAGRISDTMQGTRLLTTDDPEEAKVMARTLYDLNRERQQMQEAIVEGAINQIAESGTDSNVVIAYSPEWHPGVVGIAAAKVRERFDRSAVVIGADGKGSGRSADTFNMGLAFLQACEIGLIKKGGGHAAAGGLTVDPLRLDELREFMKEASKDVVRLPLDLDVVCRIGDLDLATVQTFDVMEPFGMGNAKPRMALVGAVLESVQIVGHGSLKGVLKDGTYVMDAMLFNALETPVGEAFQAAAGHRVDVMGEVRVGRYGGRDTLSITVDDFRVGMRVRSKQEDLPF
jgi:single-stranded-DNA-specific exonuclease